MLNACPLTTCKSYRLILLAAILLALTVGMALPAFATETETESNVPTLALPAKGVVEKISLEAQSLSINGQTILLSPGLQVFTQDEQLIPIDYVSQGMLIEFITVEGYLPDGSGVGLVITEIRVLSHIPESTTAH